jgi:hypothetical protein
MTHPNNRFGFSPGISRLSRLASKYPAPGGPMVRKKKKPCPDCKKYKSEIRRLRKILRQIRDECSETPLLMGFAIDLAEEGLKRKK